MTVTNEAPRPEFADELLARLERDRSAPPIPPAVKKALTGAAVTASVALLVAGRRKTR